MTTLDTQLANAETVAHEAEVELRALIDSAQVVAAEAFPGGTAPITVVAPVVASLPFTPNKDISSLFQTDFDTTWSDLEAWVRGLMTDWMNTYFPTLDQTLISAEDVWLKAVINNGYSGIPVALEQQIWDRARGRDTIEAFRLEEEAVSQFASRGFSMPPGVLVDRVLQVQQEAANKSSTISREAAIKQIEIAVDMTKLAIGEVTKLRLGIAAALADFMRAWMAIPQAAAEIAKAKASMHSLLWTSSADYMRAQVSIANLSMDAQKTNSMVNLEGNKLDFDEQKTHAELRVNAALQSATQMGAIASSARGAQNTLVGVIDTTARNASI